MLSRILLAQGTDRLDHNHLENTKIRRALGSCVTATKPTGVAVKIRHLKFIRDLRHKRGDLLHEAVHAALAASLQQGGNGQGGDAAVGVGDQVLQVEIARGHGRWVLHGHLSIEV